MSASHSKNIRSILTLVVFLVIVVGVGFLIGINTPPDSWYQALQKPSFNPPNWVFAPVWSVIYLLIAVAGWRIYEKLGWSAPLRLWLVQMVLNWIWSPVWFGLHAPWAAFVIILSLWLAIVGFIVSAWSSERVSSLLFVPYFAWVSFAAILNLSIAIMN